MIIWCAADCDEIPKSQIQKVIPPLDITKKGRYTCQFVQSICQHQLPTQYLLFTIIRLSLRANSPALLISISVLIPSDRLGIKNTCLPARSDPFWGQQVNTWIVLSTDIDIRTAGEFVLALKGYHDCLCACFCVLVECLFQS